VTARGPNIHRLFLLAFVAFLGGCAGLPPEDGADLPQAPVELQRWELHGRLAVRAGTDSAQGALTWNHSTDRQRILLRSPLGQTIARLTLDASGARLEDGREETRTAASAEALLREVTGWHVPLAELDWWVRGVPAPGAVQWMERDGDGRLLRLGQSGWDVRFADHRQFGRYELPGSLVLTFAPGASETIETRLVIDRWVFPR
jgi:outer membrane lipoprotein LolB